MTTTTWRRAAVAGALATTLTVAACGAGPTTAAAPIAALDPNQPVSITWETYNLLSDDAGAKAVGELVSRFEAMYPNIDVTAQPPQGEIEDNLASVQRQVAAGNPPDVVQLTFDGLQYYVDGMGAQPLEDIVGTEAVEVHLNGGEHPYHPRAATIADVDGTTVGLPYIFSTPVFYYNADVFRAAGLDPDNPPATWDEVQAAATTIAAGSDNGGGYVLCVKEGVGDWCLQGIVRSNDGRVVTEDGAGLAFGDPAAVEAITMLQNLYQAGEDVFPDATWQDALDRFKRGELGFFLSTSIIQRSLIKSATDVGFELRAAAMPSFAERPAVPTNSGAALFMFAADPVKQAAAWELMKFLTSPEAQTLITEDVGYLPLRNTLVDDPEFLAEFASTQRELIEPNLAQLDRLEGTASFPGGSFDQINTLWLDAVDEVVFRGADPATTLGEAQRRATELLPNG